MIAILHPLRIALFTAAAVGLLAAEAAYAQRSINRESQLKAGYLWFFGHYVQWPPQAFPHSRDRFVIGVLGRDTLDGHLTNVARRPVNGKQVVLRSVTSDEDYQPCDLLFVTARPAAGDTRSHAERLRAATRMTAGSPVLIVSEIPGATDMGAAINFVVDLNANRIVLEIDLVHVQQRGLSVNARLLALQQSGVVRIVRRPER